MKKISIHLHDPIVKPVWPTTIEILTKSKKGSKDFYKLLANSNQLLISCGKTKWKAVVDDKLDHEDWKAIYKHCFKLIQDNEIIWLQCRISNHILGTKILLFNIINSRIIYDTSVPFNQIQYPMYLLNAHFHMSSGQKSTNGFETA